MVIHTSKISKISYPESSYFYGMQTDKKILVLFFLPRFEDSLANSTLLRAISALPHVTVKDMYELYPDFHVDVKTEQADLEQHDIVLWMHPFYWYSCPPLMKQWIDLVLEIGWAYGPNGDALKDKWIANVLTSAGSWEAYQKDGRNRYTYKELLAPFDQTAHLCQMEYLPPFVVPAAPRLTQNELDVFAEKLKSILKLLQTTSVDESKIKELNVLNELISD